MNLTQIRRGKKKNKKKKPEVQHVINLTRGPNGLRPLNLEALGPRPHLKFVTLPQENGHWSLKLFISNIFKICT